MSLLLVESLVRVMKRIEMSHMSQSALHNLVIMTYKTSLFTNLFLGSQLSHPKAATSLMALHPKGKKLCTTSQVHYIQNGTTSKTSLHHGVKQNSIKPCDPVLNIS